MVNCSFTSNAADTIGGALLCDESDLTIANCTFSLNAALGGSALACDRPNPVVFDSVYLGNSILWDAGAEILDAVGYLITVDS
jgi:hypothetical protein